MKIISIVGARPQFIKLAPISKELRKFFIEKIVHTGQHFNKEMSKLFFEQLIIPEPDFNLGIRGGNHGEQTGKMLIGLEEVLNKEKPDLVLVFGDTNSTLAGSLAASKLGIISVHIEAGLRSFNKSMPEEINRIVSDHTSDYLFAPTKTAVKNLKNEGLIQKTFFTGDIMVDSLTDNIDEAKSNSRIIEELDLNSGDYYLLTLHRPYNVDNPKNLLYILQKLSELNEKIVFPVHPRTKQILEKNKLNLSANILLSKPLGYLDFLELELNAKKIITDSGGIQKEAYILKKPCVTLRPETEWIETVKSGWNLLLKPNNLNISDILEFKPPKYHPHLFGKNVSKKMVNLISEILKGGYNLPQGTEDTKVH